MEHPSLKSLSDSSTTSSTCFISPGSVSSVKLSRGGDWSEDDVLALPVSIFIELKSSSENSSRSIRIDSFGCSIGLLGFCGSSGSSLASRIDCPIVDPIALELRRAFSEEPKRSRSLISSSSDSPRSDKSSRSFRFLASGSGSDAVVLRTSLLADLKPVSTPSGMKNVLIEGCFSSGVSVDFLLVFALDLALFPRVLNCVARRKNLSLSSVSWIISSFSFGISISLRSGFGSQPLGMIRSDLWNRMLFPVCKWFWIQL
ncbi:hypothetical protein OGAPHI_006252 [Ogataea philodendri]|uniref:Uncharacterized protein n=1 Tax=Ogataea philodendri TaxID=1378263 RepID=A0A9P8T116_9ASCO|nr:uncharacterized protein OGAPHI_006252 [Ogataea philodendri]KAH3662071.1 hypothetical protein OGAPHI_006252 [Ogataea philodendri]